MTHDSAGKAEFSAHHTAKRTDSKSAAHQIKSWSDKIFTIPTPIKRVFDQFPLVSYQENQLPARAPFHRDEHALYIFTTIEDARVGRPSFNPGCLKWQTYLKFRGLDFRTVPSSNHASPSGALPFILPASSANDHTISIDPIPSKRFRKWVTTQKSIERKEVEEDVRYEAFASLLDHRIRRAWLYQLYLIGPNASLFQQLYVEPFSSSWLVQKTMSYQLRRAAEAELIKSAGSRTLAETEVMRDAEEAIQALSELLGTNEWFFDRKEPGLFDAGVFAYTHLLTSTGLDWQHNPLGQIVRRHANLIQHVERIQAEYFEP